MKFALIEEDVFKTFSKTTLLFANPLDCIVIVPKISSSTCLPSLFKNNEFASNELLDSSDKPISLVFCVIVFNNSFDNITLYPNCVLNFN